ncbi:LytTR family transcriptional regulator DNA-binding domain-containing protein [Nubsella zeaxanthinifaciens]|uniref:LytTR family transcriptional regulator DNA-binding domain-containing protein n=1 Tax=Nubsella zeaxanthinifaciens TaxID=392412 RepID=UPI003D08E023
MLHSIFSHIRSRFFLRNLLLLLVTAILAGHFIVTHDRDESLGELLNMPAYYRSVAYSGGIALLLLLSIYGVSMRMYRKHSGRGLTASWIREQALYGVLGVVILELFAATLLFYAMGFWIMDTAYFKKLFGPIVMFILLVNLCYLLFYQNQRPVVKIRYQFLDNRVDVRKKMTPVVVDQPALLYVENGNTWCIDFSRRRSIWTQSLNESQQRFGGEDYFRGARNWLIHRDAIVSVAQISGKRLSVTCDLQGEFKLVVSRRSVAAFKLWLDGEENPFQS